MIVIPAIDLLDGRCVRLHQGSYTERTVYDADPVETALSFHEAGAERLHLVDLDAARGSGDNRSVIRRIRSAVPGVLEVGGGVRTRSAVEELLDLGIDYAIVGTVLAREPDSVAAWVAALGSRIIASIDARDGRVRVSGWQEGTDIAAADLARRAGEMGLAAVEFTNIDRDGTLRGPDVESTLAIAAATSVPVVLSGGVSRTEEIEVVLRRAKNRLAGVIVGRALYEGHFDLPAAIAVTKTQPGKESTF